MTAPATIALIAAQELADRLSALRRAAQTSDWPGDQANETATLWLAIALAAGAKLPADLARRIEQPCIFPPGKTRLPRADRIAAPNAYLGEVARARDVARAKAEGSADQRLIQRALDLTALAEALGAPPVTTIASFETKEAA